MSDNTCTRCGQTGHRASRCPWPIGEARAFSTVGPLCVGRRSLYPDSVVCPHRTECQRYRVLLLAGDERVTQRVDLWRCHTGSFEARITINDESTETA